MPDYQNNYQGTEYQNNVPPQGQYGNVPPQGQYNNVPPQGQYSNVPPQGQYGNVPPQGQYAQPTKFCQHCGSQINANAVVCPNCGCQVNQFQQQQPTVVVNNTNTNVNAVGMGRPRDKWVAVLLCFFLGFLGAHKFYEGKAGMGILYILTAGLFGIGVLVDFITLLLKPNPYYVY
ncbi:MAG: NINE protein [Ruminococcus sp.]|nr:NINE protein [Ruminococcus sp.]